MPSKTAAPKPTVTDARQAKPTTRTPRTRKPEAGSETGQPAESTSGLDALDPMVKRHIKADADSLRLRLENMAHALIYDIGCLKDVTARLQAMSDIDDDRKVTKRFFEYYVPRLEMLLEEDFLQGEVHALSDLGEWAILDAAAEGHHNYYLLIIEMMTKKVELSPVQLMKLLERSARIERDCPSRGETWIPKSSRRASAQ